MSKYEKIGVLSDLRLLERFLDKRPTRHDNSSLYRRSLEYFGSWNNMMKAAGYKVKYYQHPKIPNKINPEIPLITAKRFSIILYKVQLEFLDPGG